MKIGLVKLEMRIIKNQYWRENPRGVQHYPKRKSPETKMHIPEHYLKKQEDKRLTINGVNNNNSRYAGDSTTLCQ